VCYVLETWKSGDVHCTIARIAERTELDRRTVSKNLHELRVAGKVWSQKERIPRRKDGRVQSQEVYYWSAKIPPPEKREETSGMDPFIKRYIIRKIESFQNELNSGGNEELACILWMELQSIAVRMLEMEGFGQDGWSGLEEGRLPYLSAGDGRGYCQLMIERLAEL